MRKRGCSFLVALLLACAIAFAGAEGAREAADECYLGVWIANGIAVEIWREDEAIQCRVVFSDGSDESEIWEYAVCFYDEAEDALRCYGVTRTRERFNSLLDDIDELDWSTDDLSLAELRQSEDGLLLTDDQLDAPVALTRLDEAEVTERNEALAFAGLWVNESSTLRVEDHGACCRFTVTVPVDDNTMRRWTYTCLYDSDSGIMASVNVSPRTVIAREADGGTSEVEEDFAASDAEFILEDGNRLVWKDLADGAETAFERSAD